MDSEQPDYRSYLLRLWWATDEDEVTLRIYVENPLTGERRGFSDLEELNTFLSEDIGLEGETRRDEDKMDA